MLASRQRAPPLGQTPTPAHHLPMHEIAHAWLVEHLDNQTRARWHHQGEDWPY